MASWMAWAQRGVDGECLSKIELPMIIGGMTDLKGSQNGKFHGMITITQMTQVQESNLDNRTRLT